MTSQDSRTALLRDPLDVPAEWMCDPRGREIECLKRIIFQGVVSSPCSFFSELHHLRREPRAEDVRRLGVLGIGDHLLLDLLSVEVGLGRRNDRVLRGIEVRPEGGLPLDELGRDFREPGRIDRRGHRDEAQGHETTPAILDLDVLRQTDQPLGAATHHRLTRELTLDRRTVDVPAVLAPIQVVHHAGDAGLQDGLPLLLLRSELRGVGTDLAPRRVQELPAEFVRAEEILDEDARLSEGLRLGLSVATLHLLPLFEHVEGGEKVRLGLLGERPPLTFTATDVTRFEAAGDGRHLLDHAVTLRFDEHASVLAAHREARHATADLGDVSLAGHGTERHERATGVDQCVLVGLVEEFERRSVEPLHRQTENHLVESRAEDLRRREARTIRHARFRAEDVHARLRPTGATRPLAAVRLADGLEVESLDPVRQLDPPLDSGVDDGIDVGDRDASLRHVRRHDDLHLPGRRRSEAALLLTRLELAVQGQDERLLAELTLDLTDGVGDLTLTRLEDQHVPTLLGEAHRLGDQVAGRSRLLLDGVEPTGDRNHRNALAVEGGQLLGLERGTHEHHLEVIAGRDPRLDPCDEDLHVEVPLVHLVEDENGLATGSALTGEFTNELQPVRDEKNIRSSGVRTLFGRSEADAVTQPRSHFLSHALGERAGGEPPGLGHDHPVTRVREELGNLGRLPCSSLGGDDGHRRPLHGFEDRILVTDDGELRAVATIVVLHGVSSSESGVPYGYSHPARPAFQG